MTTRDLSLATRVCLDGPCRPFLKGAYDDEEEVDEGESNVTLSVTLLEPSPRGARDHKGLHLTGLRALLVDGLGASVDLAPDDDLGGDLGDDKAGTAQSREQPKAQPPPSEELQRGLEKGQEEGERRDLPGPCGGDGWGLGSSAGEKVHINGSGKGGDGDDGARWVRLSWAGVDGRWVLGFAELTVFTGWLGLCYLDALLGSLGAAGAAGSTWSVARDQGHRQGRDGAALSLVNGDGDGGSRSGVGALVKIGRVLATGVGRLWPQGGVLGTRPWLHLLGLALWVACSGGSWLAGLASLDNEQTLRLRCVSRSERERY